MRTCPSWLWPLACVVAAGCAAPLVELESVRPQRGDVVEAITTNGRVEAVGGVAVAAQTSGSVVRIRQARGALVVQGQELLRLADTGQAAEEGRFRARLDAAVAALSELDAGLDPARAAVLREQRGKLAAARDGVLSDAERLQRLVAREAVPRVDLDAARRRLQGLEFDIRAVEGELGAQPPAERRDSLEAAVREAEAAWKETRAATGRLVIRAPAAGTLYSLLVGAGDPVREGQLVARIGNLDDVRVRAFVDEPELGAVRLGLAAEVTVDAYPGRTWSCEVSGLPTEVIELGPRRVGELLCDTANPGRLLLPNLSVGVRISVAEARDALTVPRAAVQGRQADPYVWIMDAAGRVAKRKVAVGLQGEIRVEIRDGLSGSETVLLPGGAPVGEGDAVRLGLGGASADD